MRTSLKYLGLCIIVGLNAACTEGSYPDPEMGEAMHVTIHSPGQRIPLSDSDFNQDEMTMNLAETEPWVFVKTGEDDYGMPLYHISVVIDGVWREVSERVEGAPFLIRTDEYATHHVPKKAISACMAWWAGEGCKFYMQRDGYEVRVFKMEVWEGMEEKDLQWKQVLEYTSTGE